MLGISLHAQFYLYCAARTEKVRNLTLRDPERSIRTGRGHAAVFQHGLDGDHGQDAGAGRSGLLLALAAAPHQG